MAFTGEQATTILGAYDRQVRQNLMGYATPEPPVEAPRLEQINSKLLALGDDILNRVGRLEAVADKAFGSLVEKGSGAGNTQALPSGDIDRIDQSISNLFDMVYRLSGVVGRLERL